MPTTSSSSSQTTGEGCRRVSTRRQAGLGLSIVQSLITGDLHGSCDVQGPREEGTTVRIRVPDPR